MGAVEVSSLDSADHDISTLSLFLYRLHISQKRL